MEWLEKIVDFIGYSIYVYYLYASATCVWYIIQFMRRDPIECLGLPDELMYRLTFGIIGEIKND